MIYPINAYLSFCCRILDLVGGGKGVRDGSRCRVCAGIGVGDGDAGTLNLFRS